MASNATDLETLCLLVENGIITVGEFRTLLGFPADINDPSPRTKSNTIVAQYVTGDMLVRLCQHTNILNTTEIRAMIGLDPLA